MLLKINGISSSNHPIKDELQRLKTYFARINKRIGADYRTIKVDQEAAKRFVKAGTTQRIGRDDNANNNDDADGREDETRINKNRANETSHGNVPKKPDTKRTAGKKRHRKRVKASNK